MISITLNQVSTEHLYVLQHELFVYALGFKEHLQKPSETATFHYSIGQVDTAQQLMLFFRPKLEDKRKKAHRFTITTTQAVVLLNACANATVLADEHFTRHVTELYKNTIDHELQSINFYN